MQPDRIYTPENCHVAYQLNWSLSIFWQQSPFPADEWLESLTRLTEQDGVRILEYRSLPNDVSQFLLSTKPHAAPSELIRSVKGRLQHLIRDRSPKAFRRNYSVSSVGSANAEAVEQYVATQADHHCMADPRIEELLAKFQFHDPHVDLIERRRSASGEFIYNLHIVMPHDGRLADVREDALRVTLETVKSIAHKEQQLLSRVGIVADHIHLAVGCDVTESPENVALGYLNNLAYAHGMKAMYQFGFYVGTFGPYDLQAVRRSL